MKSILRIALLFSYVGMIGSFAASITWSSSSSSDFTVGTNWTGNTEPGTADLAVFGTLGTQTTITVPAAGDSLGSGTSGGLSFSSGALSYTFGGTGTLTILKFTDAAANTEYLNGSYAITNSGAQFNLTGGGEVIFGTGSTLSISTNTSGQTTGSAAIDGNLLLGGSLNWSGTGTLYYDPTSLTNLTSGALTSSQYLSSYSTGTGVVDLQESLSSSSGTGSTGTIYAYAGLNVGGNVYGNGAVYLNGSGLSIAVPISFNASTTNVNYVDSNGVYILGINAPNGATGTVSGKITLLNVGGNISTDEFDVQGTDTLTVSGQITATASTNSVTLVVGSKSNSSVAKIGTGTLILSNNSSTNNTNYTGTTTVSQGTLGVTSQYAIPTTTALSVASGANFAVGNAANGLSYVGGSNGPTVGTLSLTSAGSSVGNEAELSFNIGGTSYDSLTSTGAFTLTGSAFELNVNVTPGSTGTDTLLTFGSTALTLNNIDLVLNGTDIGTSANSSYLTLNSNTLAFNASAAPEPRAWALMLGGVGLLVFVTRRRAVRSDI